MLCMAGLVGMCAVVLVWVAAFSLTCVLLVWANVPPVTSECGALWEFMVASAASPALIPAAYALFGFGASHWSSRPS